MKFLRSVICVGMVIVSCALLISCGDQSNSPAVSVQTTKFVADGSGFVQFSTNDAQYYKYGFWTTHSQAYEAQMSTVSATLKKMSGSANGGYGIVFCCNDTSNFYRLLIDAAGHYSVYAKVNGTYSPLIPWTTSANLNSGYGIENKVSVTQLSLNNFSIIFNGTVETAFSDINFSGGSAGFYVSINDQANEKFPDTPMDVRFKLSSPVVYP